MKILSRRKLREVYPGAQKAFVEFDGDIAAAENAVRSDPAKYGFDPMSILTVIQIIGLLWQLWQKHKITAPPATFDDFDSKYCEVNAFEGVGFARSDSDD